MKIQDIAFFIILLSLLVLRKKQMFLYVGLICFILAIPLFATWIFFTGERLVWYGTGFIFVFILFNLFTPQIKK